MLVNIKIDDLQFAIVNVYGPNVDDCKFVENIAQLLDGNEADHVIIGGDFNFVLDNDLDAQGRQISHVKSVEKMQLLREELELLDVWRAWNPEAKRYTWRKLKPKRIFSRLDRFEITQGLATSVTNCDIITSIKSDHAAITLTLQLDQFQRGPGFWKFNALHLSDENFKNKVRKTIVEAQQIGCLLPIDEKWEFIKSRAIYMCREYSQNIAKEILNKKIDLTKCLEILYDDLPTCNDEHITKAIKRIEQEIEEINNQKVKATIFRSRVRYAAEGERMSSYFFGLEKRNYFKNMKAVKREDGTIIREQYKILCEQSVFYEKLYTSDRSIEFNLSPGPDEVVISQAQSELLSQPLTVGELLTSVRDMKNNKCPGADGLNKEFYLEFFDLLGPILCELYKFCCARGKLNHSARIGIISLIPKGCDKNPMLLKEWRPLTLLPLEFKILSKTMAMRLQKILPDIIGPGQTGFMKGRNISTNIRRTFEVISHTKQNQIPALIMSVDFSKCFDRLEHSAIYGSMRYFKFPESFINWCKLFFTEIQVRNQNFGYASPPPSRRPEVQTRDAIFPHFVTFCVEKYLPDKSKIILT